MENRGIDIRSNKLIYPLQKLMGEFVHLLVRLILPVLPNKYKAKLEGIENNSTIQNVIGLTFFNAVGGIVIMFTNIKIANILGVTIYGLYAYYLAIGEVGSNFVRYGRHKTMTRDLIQKPNEFEILISNTFVLSLINLVIFCLGIILLSKQLDIPFKLSSWLLIIGASIGCIDFQPVYESLRLMSWHAIYYLIQKIIFFLGIWIAILLIAKPSLTYISVVFFISWFIIIIIQYWEIIIKLGIKIIKFVSWNSIKRLYKSNFLIALSCMTGVAFGPVIQLVLKEYASSKYVGLYAAGVQIFIICQFLMNQIARVGNPMMAEAGKKNCSSSERKKFVTKYTVIMLITALPFLIPLIVFPHYIVDLFYSNEYYELQYYLPWFGVYLTAFAVGVVFTQFLISIRKDMQYFTIYVLSAILTIVCAFSLIPIYGLLGAIISLCIPHSIGCIFYFLVSLKYLK